MSANNDNNSSIPRDEAEMVEKSPSILKRVPSDIHCRIKNIVDTDTYLRPTFTSTAITMFIGGASIQFGLSLIGALTALNLKRLFSRNLIVKCIKQGTFFSAWIASYEFLVKLLRSWRSYQAKWNNPVPSTLSSPSNSASSSCLDSPADNMSRSQFPRHSLSSQAEKVVALLSDEDESETEHSHSDTSDTEECLHTSTRHNQSESFTQHTHAHASPASSSPNTNPNTLSTHAQSELAQVTSTGPVSPLESTRAWLKRSSSSVLRLKALLQEYKQDSRMRSVPPNPSLAIDCLFAFTSGLVSRMLFGSLHWATCLLMVLRGLFGVYRACQLNNLLPTWLNLIPGWLSFMCVNSCFQER